MPVTAGVTAGVGVGAGGVGAGSVVGDSRVSWPSLDTRARSPAATITRSELRRLVKRTRPCSTAKSVIVRVAVRENLVPSTVASARSVLMAKCAPALWGCTVAVSAPRSRCRRSPLLGSTTTVLSPVMATVLPSWKRNSADTVGGTSSRSPAVILLLMPTPSSRPSWCRITPSPEVIRRATSVPRCAFGMASSRALIATSKPAAAASHTSGRRRAGRRTAARRRRLDVGRIDGEAGRTVPLPASLAQTSASMKRCRTRSARRVRNAASWLSACSIALA